jgi:uracil-DNA glycosylase
VLWVGAAPGNAGGLGSSDLGAHGTRIPFGGDIAGGNLDVLLSSIGLSRNDTFIVAALNQLPLKGGGEPTLAEMAAPVGRYPDSVALIRDTVVATGPDLIVALGNVALRALSAALTRDYSAPVGDPARPPPPLRLPSTARLAAAGFRRGTVGRWPAALPLHPSFADAWRNAWNSLPEFMIVQLLHPSAQNMSPFAGQATVFHSRMVETRDALVEAARLALGIVPSAVRPAAPDHGIYALPEYRDRVAERHARYDSLWRDKGI